MGSRGMTLMEVMIGVAILAILALSLTGLIVSNQSTVTSDLRGDGARRLNAGTGELLREAGFVSIILECRRVGALEQAATNATCLAADGGLAADSAATPSPYPLEKRVDAFGVPSPSGEYCTQISRCHLLGGGRLVQVDFVTFYDDKSNGPNARPIPHMIRVTR